MADHIISFYKNLKPNWKLPKGIELIFPFDDGSVWNLTKTFYKKYYNDISTRHFLFGINPGRLGAGVTGLPFTDPIFLADSCGIENDKPRKHELSSIFIYKMIGEFGGPDAFYSKFYISSLCPLGFTKEGRNYNYYDSKDLYEAVEKHITNAINDQIDGFARRDKAFSLGQGKNYKIFTQLNDQHQWFDEVIPLPHPRWIMQYKRKTMQIYLDEYLTKLGTVN